MGINCSWINLGIKFKNHFKVLSKVAEELLVKATTANNVSVFKMVLCTFDGITVCDSKGPCSGVLPSQCCSHAESWVISFQG